MDQVAPQYKREVAKISLEGVDDASSLSTEQILKVSAEADHSTVPSQGQVVRLTFSDGTSIKSKAAYLTMLPFDLRKFMKMCATSFLCKPKRA